MTLSLQCVSSSSFSAHLNNLVANKRTEMKKKLKQPTKDEQKQQRNSNDNHTLEHKQQKKTKKIRIEEKQKKKEKKKKKKANMRYEIAIVNEQCKKENGIYDSEMSVLYTWRIDVRIKHKFLFDFFLRFRFSLSKRK